MPRLKGSGTRKMIECQDLGKRYGKRWLFRGLNFRVETGECLIVLGKNGAGKSTLLKILAGLIPPTEGKSLRPNDPRTMIGYAALDQAVYPTLTVREHLILSGKMRGCAAREDELLEEVGLAYAASSYGKVLSSGMRARLRMALAIQAEPQLIMFDEPGAGLDESGRQVLATLIRNRQSRTAFILATNDPFERQFATHEIELVD